MRSVCKHVFEKVNGSNIRRTIHLITFTSPEEFIALHLNRDAMKKTFHLRTKGYMA